MKNETVLVVGASGMVGSEIVRLLKAQGAKVRSTSSKANANDPSVVKVDLVTGEGLSAAFEGVDRAFLLSPPGFADQYKILSPLIQESKRRSLKKVVLMTAMGANAVETAPFRRAEIELEKSGLNYNIIRPNWFMQNFNTFWVGAINSASKIMLPAGTAQTSFIDARDISAVAAHLLLNDELSGRDFDLTGARAVDHSEMARLISSVAGREVSYQETTPEEFRSGLIGAGLPADYVDFMVLIMGFLREGYNSRVTTSVRDILGREPRSLEQYAADNRGAWA